MKYIVYTDGACSGNPGAGGWAFLVLYKGKQKMFSGCKKDTTNNRMELLAIVRALEVLPDGEIIIYSDSAYCINTITQGWVYNWMKNDWKTKAGEEVKNRDLWERYLKAISTCKQVSFFKVKGHSYHKYNDMVDQEARRQAQKLKTKQK